MIFSRRRKADRENDPTPTEAAEVEPGSVEDGAGADGPADGAGADGAADGTGGEAQADTADAADERDWAEFDRSQDWRADGPFDISEVDLDADDVKRVDLGALVITPKAGMELRLQVAQDSGSVVAAMVLLGQSALELAVFAAPRSGGLWAEIRDDVVEATTAQGGTTTLAEGPFGTELRRLVPVRTPNGEEGYQPSRTWAVEGDRWLLRGVVYGQAALVEGLGDPTPDLHDVFASTVVRRGDQAMAAGDVITMTVPDDIKVRPPANAQG